MHPLHLGMSQTATWMNEIRGWKLHAYNYKRQGDVTVDPSHALVFLQTHEHGIALVVYNEGR